MKKPNPCRHRNHELRRYSLALATILAAAPVNLSAALAYGYDQAFAVVHEFETGFADLFCPDLLCAGVATPLTTIGSGQWESIFSDGQDFYGYDTAFGVVHRFDNGVTNLVCPDLLCAGVATPLTTIGSGQWESLFLSPAVTIVPLPNAVALFTVALFTLTLVLARPLSYDQLSLRLH